MFKNFGALLLVLSLLAIGLTVFYTNIGYTVAGYKVIGLYEQLVSGSSNVVGNETQKRDLREFASLQQKILDGQAPFKIVFNCLEMNGYANRVYAVLSEFVVALLDDRFLNINGWSIIADYIESPFNRTFEDFNESTPFSMLYQSEHIQHIPVQGTEFKLKKSLKTLISANLATNVTRLQMCGVDPIFFPICATPRYYEKLYNFGLVSRATIDDAYEKAPTSLANIKKSKSKRFSTAQRLDSLLRVGFEVAGNLLNKHWRPKPLVQRQVDYYVDTFFKGRFVVGFQIRTTYLDNDNMDIKAFVECAERIGLKLANGKEVRWFVTADAQNLIDSLHDEYPDKMIMVNGTIGHVFEDPSDVHKVYELYIN